MEPRTKRATLIRPVIYTYFEDGDKLGQRQQQEEHVEEEFELVIEDNRQKTPDRVLLVVESVENRVRGQDVAVKPDQPEFVAVFVLRGNRDSFLEAEENSVRFGFLGSQDGGRCRNLKIPENSAEWRKQGTYCLDDDFVFLAVGFSEYLSVLELDILVGGLRKIGKLDVCFLHL